MPFYLDGNEILRWSELERWPWLVHGFSTRAAGNLGRSTGNPDRPLEHNQRKFVGLAGGNRMKLLKLRQVHSSLARVVHGRTVSGLAGDSLLTRQHGLLLGIKTADCLPILLVDSRQRAVGAVHAGWRGAVRRVAEKAVGEMRLRFGCDPADLHAAIGAGIQACCFQVGSEVLDEFACQFVDADQFCRRETPNPALCMLPRQILTDGNRPFDWQAAARGNVDLAEANRRQLLAAGLPAGQIYNAGLCTACDREWFYSHRREKEAAGRMLAVIGVRGDASARS